MSMPELTENILKLITEYPFWGMMAVLFIGSMIGGYIAKPDNYDDYQILDGHSAKKTELHHANKISNSYKFLEEICKIPLLSDSSRWNPIVTFKGERPYMLWVDGKNGEPFQVKFHGFEYMNNDYLGVLTSYISSEDNNRVYKTRSLCEITTESLILLARDTAVACNEKPKL